MDVRPPIAVYRLFDGEDQLVYVGQTDSLGTRWGAHRRRTWWADVTRYTLEWHTDPREATAAERAAIRDEKPRENRTDYGQQWTLEELRDAPTEPRRRQKATRRPKDSGGVFQRSRDGLWCAQVDAGYTETGLRRRKMWTSKDRAVVERKLADYLAQQ